MLQMIILFSFVIVPALCSPVDQWMQTLGELPKEINNNNTINSETDYLNYNKLVLSFVVFRHGDRTPDQMELDKYPSQQFNDSIFYPFGKKALTNKGKERAFLVGEYLRKRYNDTISQLYLPDEISVRTTDYARTKMTALIALAAMYPPQAIQRWNTKLNWQPIPYDTMAWKNDDLLHFNNCPRYEELKNKIYELPALRTVISSYENLFEVLSAKTGATIKTPENVFFLDNLFQTLNNTGVSLPQWVDNLMPKIKEMTKIEYLCLFYNNELIRLSGGVLMAEIIEAIDAAIAGNEEQVKLRLYSGHENNVAALLAAARVFKPHQPKYGSTVSLESRKNVKTGKYGIMVVYAAEAGGPGVVLPIEGCGGKPICDYETFLTLTRDVLLSRSEYNKQCLTP
ncbi:venom acid phosphatase Acph-1-like [Nymphalis io]|uniref:venom acid phosphatase Acph-1-like n=1 Tax=Inachis io TaxID=171585 RepID=UPI002166FDAF|nr:venom acid phosphatase Acph-1-like [Nymphalis io]